MRIRVQHETTYQFQTPARAVLQVLRMTPRNFEGQHVANWRIDVNMDCRLTTSEDAFGNIVHEFSADGPVSSFAVLVEGEVETSDTAGVVRGTRENFPAELYLRPTDLTQANPKLSTWAHDVTSEASDQLGKLHLLLAACHSHAAFDPALGEATALETFAAQSANAAGLAHLFMAASRSLGAPARCISGYVLREEPVGPESLHVWAEAHVPGLGWVAFDPAYDHCPSDRHIRIACALDYLGARPVRASHSGHGEDAKMDIRVVETQAQRQWQS